MLLTCDTDRMSFRREYDYLIAGGGTAAAVLARRLVERRAGSVLLLEAGPDIPRILDVPLLSMPAGRWRYSWPLVSQPQAGLGGRLIRYPAGRVLGGSSSVNAMIALGPNESDLQRWELVGGAPWGKEALAGVAERAWGSGSDPPAPLSIRPARYSSDFAKAFVDAGEAAGLHRQSPVLRECLLGQVGHYGLLMQEGRRYSAVRAYLDPVRHDPLLTLVTGAQVRRLCWAGRRVAGVEWRHDGRILKTHAAAEVVVAMGALASPVLLLRSGIGPGGQLRDAGIDVHCELDGVGQGLQDHVNVQFQFRRRAAPPLRPWRVLGAVPQYLREANGLLTSNFCEAGAFFSPRHEAEARIQIITHLQARAEARDVALDCVLLRPRSQGRLWLDPARPMEKFRFDLNLLADEEDARELAESLEFVRHIAGQSALRARFLTKETAPGSDVRRIDDVIRYVRANASTAHHCVGTCRLGSDAQAVVDPECRVHGTEGLRVVDASVMPALPSCNTTLPVVLVAERASDFIAAP